MADRESSAGGGPGPKDGPEKGEAGASETTPKVVLIAQRRRDHVRKFSWRPGQSGNPKGRPKTLRQFRERIQKEGYRLYVELLKIAYDRSDPEQMRAIELLLAYGYGRPSQKLELELHDLRSKSDSEIDEMIAEQERLLLGAPEEGDEDK